MNCFTNYVQYQNYVRELHKNENNTNIDCIKDRVSKSEYRKLLSNALEIINKYNGVTSLIRQNLYQSNNIGQMFSDFVYKSMATPGLLLDYGTRYNRDILLAGNMQECIMENGKLIEEKKEMQNNTIFDLASTSKLFTSIAIHKLYEDKVIDLYDPITKYVPEFVNLSEVTIYDLLKFRIKLQTDKRIDQVSSNTEALNILYNIKVKEILPTDAYDDMGAMVLRILIERVTRLNFYDFIRAVILVPAHMDDTYLNVPEEKLNRVANENYGIIVDKDGNYKINTHITPGKTYDGKSIAMGHDKGIAPGHAGMFSTNKDMINLAYSLIDGRIISKKSLLMMSETSTGFTNDSENTYTRFYGSLVYLKQLDPTYLGVYKYLSGKSIMSPGYAGTTLIIDPLNEIVVFIGGNRLHNRIYRLDGNENQKIVKDADNKMTYDIDGNEKLVSAYYTRDKELLFKNAIELSMKYQLVEKINKQKKELHLVREL